VKDASALCLVFFFQFDQGREVFTNLFLSGFHVDLIRGALSVSNFFCLLSFGTHFHLHGEKIKDPDQFRIVKIAADDAI
jgi:hypothetical protein